jgi:AcrR family transcriptional regulator
VQAAVQLWSEGDFEDAYERTTPADIARVAGVSRGTFYFHFPNKQELLRELVSAIARDTITEVVDGISQGVPLYPLVDQVMSSMARRVSRLPAGVGRRVAPVVMHYRMSPTTLTTPRGTLPALETLIRYGMERGELGPGIDVEDAAAMWQSVILDSVTRRAVDEHPESWLRQKLCDRAEILLRGLNALAAARVTG